MLAKQNETKNSPVEEISQWTDRSLIRKYLSTPRIIFVVVYASSAYLSGTRRRNFFVKFFYSVIQEDRIKLVE